MPLTTSDTYFDQQKRVAEAKGKLLEAIGRSGEKDISIWIAVLVELLKKFSDWNLAHERGEATDQS